MTTSQRKIITYTVAHVGSTLIANINTGLFEPKKPIQFVYPHDLLNPQYILPEDRITLKSHPPPNNEGVPTYNIDVLLETVKMRSNGQTYFVYVNREDHPIIKTRLDNMMLLDYEKILYKNVQYNKTTTCLHDVIDYIVTKYTEVIPELEITQNMIHNAVTRVNEMDRVAKEMKTQPFQKVDSFFQIHGGHRGRLNPKESKRRNKA